MIPWRFNWNNIRLRPAHTVLTILGIAGGVAAVVAVLQSTAATRSQLDSLHQTLDVGVAMEIVAADAAPFAHGDLAPLSHQPGVDVAVPTFRLFARIAFGSDEVRGIVIGADLAQYRRMRDFSISRGRICTSPGEVCVEASVADRLGIAAGDELRIWVRGVPRLVPKRVVGILKPQGIGAAEETAAIFMPLADAARLGRAPGKATALQIVLDSGVESEAESDTVADAIKRQLPDQLVLVRTASAADLSRSTESLINFSLNATAVLSVVAAIFIALNTFQMSVAERQRQLALLRIVGATTAQVRLSIYLEALAFAVVGTIVGIFLGVSGSHVLSQGMVEIFGLGKDSTTGMRTHAILAGLLFGPLVTLVSVWHPAREACNAVPLAVLKSASAPRREFPIRECVITGLLALFAAIVVFACANFDLFPMWTSVLALVLTQLSGLLCLPALVGPGSSLIYRPLGRLFMVEARVGQRQLQDNFGRTSLTIAVLFVVTSTSVSIGSTTLSVARDVDLWLDRTVTADFLLRASRPRIDMSESESVSDEIESRIAAIPGIVAIDRMSFQKATVNGAVVTLMIRQLAEFSPMPIDVIAGDLSQVRDRVLSGEAVIGSVLAHKIDCGPGDTVRINVSGISHSVRVAGVARQFNSGGMLIIMDRTAALELFPIPQIHAYGIRSDRSATAAVGMALQGVARKQGLIFQSMSDLRELIRSMLAGVTSRLWMILALALAIAGFGVINTMTMNVIQQARILGVLRVVGMSRLQVTRMFLLQAFVSGLLAVVPGIVMGAIMAFLVSVSYRGTAEHGIVFSLHPMLLIGYYGGAMILSVMAATVPAIHAGRLKPLEAIHLE